MPFVCTGNLGPHYQYGQVIEGAEHWPPHLRALHQSSGALTFCDDAALAQIQAEAANRRRVSALKRLNREHVARKGAKSAAASKVAQLKGELAAAELVLSRESQALGELELRMASESAGLVTASSAPPVGAPNAEQPVEPQVPAAPPVKTDEELRKAIYAEIASFGRRALIEFAKAAERKHDAAGKIIGSGYGIDLSVMAHEPKDDVVAAFIKARIAQIRASESPKQPADEPVKESA